MVHLSGDYNMTIEVGAQGGGAVIDSVSINNTSASGSSGALFSVPVVSGKRIIITGLAPQTTSQTNIEIKFGTRVVYTGTIADAPTAGELTILSSANVGANEYLASSTISELPGGFGEDLTITKTSSSTTATVYLSYIVVI